nr:ribbon-helix-helix protein, CopG family [Micromonospora sp. DSM 115978]
MIGGNEPGGVRRGSRPTNQSRRYGQRPAAGDPVDLGRVTVDLTPQIRAAIDELCERGWRSRTDAINRAIRVAVLLRRYADENGVTTVTGPDGRQFDIEVV